MVTFFRLTCSVVLWGGRNTANKYHWRVLTVIQPHWVCPRSWHVFFTSLHCSGSRFLCQELSDAGPGLHALSRSSRSGSGSGTPQRHRLGWAYVLCPSQVRGAQATRYLVSALSPPGRCILSPPLSQALSFLGVQREHCLRCAMCLLWGDDL